MKIRCAASAATLLRAALAVSLLAGCGPRDDAPAALGESPVVRDRAPSARQSQPIERGDARTAAAPALERLPRTTNVVLIVLDTLRADKLGCYGFPEDTSPEIDALAAHGVRFANAISQSPWTRPSIGSMLTGLYPRTLGLYRERNERLPDGVVTLADAFKQRGFTTIGATANPNINAVFGFARSFDHYVDSNRVWDWMREKDGKPDATAGSLMPAARVFAQAIEAIRRFDRPPYYLQLDVMEMHEYGAPARRRFKTLFEGHPNQRYLQQLRELSHAVADFVDEIAGLPGMRETLFVLTSDHGEGLDDHPRVPLARHHGYVLYDSQLQVPLIFYHSQGKIGRGVVVEQRVRTLDVMATILDLMGWQAPPQAGRSLVPLFTDPGADVGIPAFEVAETQFRRLDSISVYGAEWRYFEHRRPVQGLAERELQRARAADGAATSELAEHPEHAHALTAHLAAWEARYEKKPPTPVDGVSEETLRQLHAIGYIE
jgi:arylsulfatase A-like enzyme